jgi:hypothetical protein
MPGQKPIKSSSWEWFKTELEHRLGKAEADALWAELSERRAQERIANERTRAPQMIADLEARIAAARGAGKPTLRLEQQLRRWRALLGS